MVWATFWAIFSQTHPVTLLPEKTQREREKKNFFCSSRYIELFGS
jgi:hypothetical protein